MNIMSRMPSKIEHQGRIVEMDADCISVEIVSKSACAACHAKGVCGAAEEQVRTVVVPHTLETAASGLKVGDSVKLVLASKLGMKATVIAYGVPLLVLLAALMIFSALKLEQLYVGLFSLASVAVYYIIIAIFRDNLDKEFYFTIEL